MLKPNRFRLFLVRHGESEVNIQPDLMGQDPDTPLTEKGRQQAEALGKSFRNYAFDYVYSSDYVRAHDTAKIVCAQPKVTMAYVQPVLVPELREYSAGDWKHASRKETLTPEIQLKMASLNNTFQPPHGEALNQVEHRASKWLDDQIIYSEEVIENAYARLGFKFEGDKLVKHNFGPRGDLDALNIAVFSHGMTIKCLLHYVMGFDKSMTWKIDINNTSVTTLSFNLNGEVGWRVHGINDTSHLRK